MPQVGARRPGSERWRLDSASMLLARSAQGLSEQREKTFALVTQELGMRYDPSTVRASPGKTLLSADAAIATIFANSEFSFVHEFHKLIRRVEILDHLTSD